MSESQGTQQPPASRLNAASWGLGLMFGALLCALRFFEIPDNGASDSLRSYLTWASGGAVLTGALLAISPALNVPRRRLRTRSLGQSAVGTVAALLGIIPLATHYGLSVAPLGAFAPLLGLALGVGVSLLIAAWASLYGRMEPEELLPNGAASVALGSIVQNGQELAGSGIASLAIMALSLVGSTALLVAAQRRFRDAADLMGGDGAAATDESGHRLPVLTRALFLPLIGAGLASFIFGLIWDPIVSEELARDTVFQGRLSSLAGPLLTVGAVAIVVSRDRGTSPLRIFNQYVLPVAVAVLLIVPFIAQALPGLLSITDIFSSASFAVIALSAWCTLASTSHSLDAPARAAAGEGLVACALMFALGLHAIMIVGTHGRVLCLVLSAFYLVAIALSFVRDSREERTSRTPDAPAENARNLIRRQCDELSSTRGLSPRERDVLYYLGRGYNHTYIAQKLFISENTVRTHVRHIYGKLGVTSREELLDLIDGN